MSNANNRLLLLCHSRQHAEALMGCLPHIRANYGWVWVVYSPAVLADPALVEREFDQSIADLTRAMKDCYAREDGAGGDAYKVKRDAAILEKTAKVKDAWKSLPKEQQTAAVNALLKPFFDAVQGTDGMSCAISQSPDHFETAAHVEMQNSLKAGMKPGYLPGEYVVAWPTSLPKGAAVAPAATQTPGAVCLQTSLPADPTAVTPAQLQQPPAAPAVKIDKRTKEYKARLGELKAMAPADLGAVAFELGIKPTDPIAAKKDDLIEKIIELEHTTADVNSY